MVGILPVSGNGARIVAETVPDPQSLLDDAATLNLKTLSRLREDQHSLKLHEGAKSDAELGRMSAPTALQAEMTLDRVLSPRFAVEQGTPFARPCSDMPVFPNARCQESRKMVPWKCAL